MAESFFRCEEKQGWRDSVLNAHGKLTDRTSCVVVSLPAGGDLSVAQNDEDCLLSRCPDSF